MLITGSSESKFAQVAKEGLMPEANFYIGRNIILFGYHIHHFYFGILLIILAGWIAIVKTPNLKREQVALIYGTGLGLFMDEIGLLLTWGDYYSGLTYLLSLFVGGVLLNIIYFPYFWYEVKNNLTDTNPHSIIVDLILKKTNFIEVVDKMSEKASKTERASLTFTGIIYMFVGALILLYPQFLYYWVAGVFFIQGISSLVRAWQGD